MPLYLRSDDDPLLKAIQDSAAVKKGDDHYLPQRAHNEHHDYNVQCAIFKASLKKNYIYSQSPISITIQAQIPFRLYRDFQHSA